MREIEKKNEVKYKEEKAITMITLVITIILMLILVGVTMAATLGENGIITKAQQAINSSKIAQIEEEISLWYLENEIAGTISKEDFLQSLVDLGLITEEEKNNASLNDYIQVGDTQISLDKAVTGGSSSGEGSEEGTEGDEDPLNPDDDKYANTTTDGWNSDEGVNSPALDEGMIPIKWDSASSTWTICSTDDENWYQYESLDWANIMLSDGKYDTTTEVGTSVATTDLGSMFVWIPRYSYSIKQYKTAVSGSEGSTQEIFDITFLMGTTNKDEAGTSYASDYDENSVVVGDSTPYIVHPAFEFDGNQITGFWSAKFESSMMETNTNNSTYNNTLTPTVKVVPNALTWRYISVGNCFGNAIEMNDENNIYKIEETVETMLMKNNQWGAIAYLTTSKYGKTPVINDYYVLSTTYYQYAAEKNYVTNVTLSTTGNTTGIYDMNGGCWEYVASYWENGNDNIETYGTTEYFENSEIKEEYAKYWESYDVSDAEIRSVASGFLDNTSAYYNSARKLITDDRYYLMASTKGDALYEIIKTYSYYGISSSSTNIWMTSITSSSFQYGTSYYNSDYALIGSNALPFLQRGGAWGDSSGAGVFSSTGNFGCLDVNIRFSCGSCGSFEHFVIPCTLFPFIH